MATGNETVYTCYNRTGNRHGPYLERFADVYGSSYAKGRVVHRDGTSHKIGVGAKPYGGTWGSSGASTQKSTGVGYDSGYTIADAGVMNKIWQRYYYTDCYTDQGTQTSTWTQPDGWHSGPYYTQIGHINYAYCETAYAGHTYNRTSYTNKEFVAGVGLGFVNLSAQSGWTTTTEMHYQFGSRSGKLCGSNGAWPVAARVSAT